MTTYSYDPASRLTSLGHDFADAAHDVTSSFTYTAASQIGSRSRSNDLYAFTAAVAGSRAYINNGLNQHSSAAGAAQSYDGRGNLTASGVDSYVYTSENRLASFTKNGAVQSYVGYDGLGQLALMSPQVGVPKLDYLMVADGVPQFEFNSVTGLLRRHVHGPGSDEPLLTYEGAGLSDKRYLHADERGSIIAISNGSGQVTQINAYDDYGIPQGKNASGAPYSGGTATASFGRFGYTGQAWLPEVGLYHYKARAYSPTMGRFMQTDPIGYGDGVNLYAYVGGDPVNFNDPSGLGAASRDVDPKRIIPIDCPSGFICVRAYDAPDPPPRGLGFLLSANVPGDRGGPSFGERNDGAAAGEGMPKPCPAATAKRTPPKKIPISKGFRPSKIDPSNRFVTDKAGKLQINPNFQRQIDNTKIDKVGVANDLISIFLLSIPIAGEFVAAQKFGEAAVKGIDLVVAAGEAANTANDTVSELNKMCK